MKTFVIFLFIWMILSAIGYGIGNFIFYPTRLEYLAKEGRGIYGRVTAKEPENHQIIRYSFTVVGKEYPGGGSSGNGNPVFNDIQIGDQVIVYYDPANPEHSIMGYPQFYLESQYTGILFVTVVFPVFPMIFIFATYFGIRAAKKAQPN